MLVRIWGTRGSLPTLMWNDQIRIKARAIAKAASGQTFADDDALEAFLDEQPYWMANTYGGETSCLELAGEKHLLCDFGSGARRLGGAMLGKNRLNIAGEGDIFRL